MGTTGTPRASFASGLRTGTTWSPPTNEDRARQLAGGAGGISWAVPRVTELAAAVVTAHGPWSGPRWNRLFLLVTPYTARLLGACTPWGRFPLVTASGPGLPHSGLLVTTAYGVCARGDTLSARVCSARRRRGLRYHRAVVVVMADPFAALGLGGSWGALAPHGRCLCGVGSAGPGMSAHARVWRRHLPVATGGALSCRCWALDTQAASPSRVYGYVLHGRVFAGADASDDQG